MRTEEIMNSLGICAGVGSCDVCDYADKAYPEGCAAKLKNDAALRLEELCYRIEEKEKRIDEAGKTIHELTETNNELKSKLNKGAGLWVSVNDRMPEKMGELYFVYRKNGNINLSIYLNHYWNYGDVTHWMPIPEPPKPPKKVKTYKDVFFEKFQKATITAMGRPAVCRNNIFGEGIECKDVRCEDCWNQSYPEEEGGAE